MRGLMSQSIPITRVSQSRLTEALRENSEFGATFSDHMLVVDWESGSWKQPQIVPFGPISFSPALTPFHYGQAIFEGFKAHRTAGGGVALFRPRENFTRLNRSATRLAMPEIPELLFLEGVAELVRLDRDWVPHREGGSLYVRPTYFGVDDTLLVRPANRFRLIVMTSPVGPYFAQPIRLLAEERFVRAFPGGTGDSKAAGNYAGGLLAAHTAGKLTEAFGAGTAAIVAPIACIRYRDRDLQFSPVSDSSVAARLRSRLVAIQTGRQPDTHNWLLPI